MPNYCQNEITISSPNANDIRDIDAKRVGNHAWGGDGVSEFEFNQFVPIPQDVLRIGYNGENRNSDGSDDKIPSGYNWEHNNWGIKWGFITDVDVDFPSKDGLESEMYIVGYTPWAPPIAFFAKLSKMYPDTTIIIKSEEPGMAFGCCATIQNGEGTVEEWEIKTMEDSFENIEIPNTRKTIPLSKWLEN
jgi:hypothetical protein